VLKTLADKGVFIYISNENTIVATYNGIEKIMNMK
jgi:hypothetical protein